MVTLRRRRGSHYTARADDLETRLLIFGNCGFRLEQQSDIESGLQHLGSSPGVRIGQGGSVTISLALWL